MRPSEPHSARELFKPIERSPCGDLLLLAPQGQERDGEDALQYVLSYYTQLVAFYKRAADHGQAIILLIT